MATLAANVYREAELDKRLRIAANVLSELEGVEMPPPFPYARDEHYRRNDERERLVIFVENLAKARQAARTLAEKGH